MNFELSRLLSAACDLFRLVRLLGGAAWALRPYAFEVDAIASVLDRGLLKKRIGNRGQ